MLRLTVLEGPDKGKLIEFSEHTLSLGSAPDSYLQLSDPYVSHHHGQITLAGDRWTYRDLGSTNGSVVEKDGNRTELEPGGPGAHLASGDLILIGQTVLRIEVVEEPQPAIPEHTVVAARTLGDLTASRQQQLESPDDLSVGYQLEQGISLAFDPEEMLDAVLDSVLTAFPAATHVILLLVDKKTLQPRRQVARVRGEEGRVEEELPVSMSVANRVLREGRSLLFQDVPAEFQDSKSVLAAGIRSSLCAPLWTGEETVGLIQVESRGGRAGFSERDLDRLTLFANRAALAIIGSELCEAERRSQLMRDLSDMITHDLKGPLTSILGFLQLLETENLVDDQREYVQFALGAAKWLSVLIAGILDVAKMEASEIQMEREPLDIRAECEEALSLISCKLAEKEMVPEITCPPDLPRPPASRDLFRRIIINLAGNAAELSPTGSKLTISGALSRDSDSVVVSVQDEGPGIPPEHQARIFDKFFQAGSRRTSGRKMSVGLGLAFCKLAVDAHGGDIWVESEPGEGARFSFSLPLDVAPHAQRAA
ncbi:MAG: GAF domain-containing protein [Armatimonadota bacterium]|nr:MAG: GAF domain-containing protein [Armatimonadota bacterium]